MVTEKLTSALSHCSPSRYFTQLSVAKTHSKKIVIEYYTLQSTIFKLMETEIERIFTMVQF